MHVHLGNRISPNLADDPLGSALTRWVAPTSQLPCAQAAMLQYHLTSRSIGAKRKLEQPS